ncbi:MAG: DUF4331 family protein, partial [Pyrinomonadaceae bacterium]
MFKQTYKKPVRVVSLALMVSLLGTAILFSNHGRRAEASSHREAPLIAADPLADNTDLYAFRSTEAGREGFVTLIANWIPFEEPSGGPHFYRFDDTVLYEIKIDNTGDGVEDITYQFRFTNSVVNPDSILGMAAPNENLSITSLNDPDYNERQTYSVTRIESGNRRGRILGAGFISPPNNIGDRTTPNYENALALPAVYPLPNGGRVFA